MSQQLILNMPIHQDSLLENFIWRDDLALLKKTLLASLDFTSHAEKFLYLWGEESSGKSHLLQASCHYLGNQGLSCAYLPLKQLVHLSPELLDNLEHLSLIAIDDLEALTGNPAWEEALFHCYNKVAAQEKTLLFFTSTLPIASLNFQLADLHSRLRACMISHITPLDEPGCIFLLQKHALRRGLHLSPEVIEYLIRRFPRNPGKLLEIFEKLDQAAWEKQHRLTIPFVKKTLAL